MPKPNKPLVTRRTDTGKWYNVILAANGEVLNMSEVFNDRKSALRNFNAVAKVFLANHPTEEQVAQFLLGYLTDPNNDNAASANRANAERFARAFLLHFRSVQDCLTEYVHVEKRKK